MRKNKFLFYNLIALIFIKAVFSYSGSQLANLADGLTPFSREEVIDQTNTLRQTLGLKGLKENIVLNTAASQKLQDMVQNQYFAHTSPAGVSPWHWIGINNYIYSYAGENLAIGFWTAEDTVSAWANSPSHRDNLLNPNYEEIGIAVAPAQIQNTRGFLVVQLFGTPKPAVPAVAVKPATTTPSISLASSAPAATSNEVTEEPIAIKVGNTSPEFARLAGAFNTAFVLYALIIFLAALVAAAFYGLRKQLVIRTAASFAILVLAIVVPVLQTTHTAFVL